MSIQTALYNWQSSSGLMKSPLSRSTMWRENQGFEWSPHLGEDVSGLLIANDDSSIVCLQASDAPCRMRFTLAHEIAHYVLGHQFERGEHVHVDRGNYISQRGLRASTGLDPKEIDANQFAATLLMPPQLLRAEVHKRNGQEGAPRFAR